MPVQQYLCAILRYFGGIGILQLWSALDFKPIKTLAGHESKLSGVDVAAGESFAHTQCT
jgi:hypothetical protein